MTTTEAQNKAFVLEAFDTLFNKRDYGAAERFWSPAYIQHSAHIAPGREGLFELVKAAPKELHYENALIVADGDYVMLHGRFSGIGQPVNWVVVDILRIENGLLAEHWDVIIVRELYNYRSDVNFKGWKVMSRLSGKTAVVTGASKGIGAGIAKGLAAEGAAVVVNYASSKDGAERVVADIKAKGGKAIAVQGDVAKPADVKKLFAETKQAFGRLDILVNNAGVYNFLPLEEITEEDFRRQFNINVLGLLLATQEAAKLFGDEGGSVINIGSVVNDLNSPNTVVYTATKGAVDAVTRVLAKELGPRKIRVNAIKPGLIDTEGTHAMGFIGNDYEKQAVARTPLGRTGQPDDIAPVAVFLASDESRWVTGDTLAVSGGVS